MKTTFLFPHRFKTIGWIVFIPSVILGLLALITNDHLLGWRMNVLSFFGGTPTSTSYFNIITTDITYTLTGSLVIMGALLIAFSKEQHEDEYVAQLRLASFQWAVLVNYGLLLVAFLAVYGINFLLIIPYNMFTVIVLFIARFHYLTYNARKIALHEKQS